MRRSQLAINRPAPLLQRLRAEAQQQGVTATALVLQWIEAGLDGDLGRSSPSPSSDLEARLDALEQRLDALPAPPRAIPPSPQQAPPPAELMLADLPDGAITTAELADRTSTNKAAWNNWAKQERVGQVRSHPQAGSWRLVGKGQPPGDLGGPLRWLWESV